MILAFNKPFGVLCQFTPGKTAVAGRLTLADFISEKNIYPAGRLDEGSEGLLILTDERGLASRLTEPHFAHPRVYLAQVEGIAPGAALEKLRQGVLFDGEKSRPAKIRSTAEPDWLWPRDPPVRMRNAIPTSWIELTLTEGRNRQVRKMTAAAGHPTLRLIRVKIGEFELGELRPGESRKLTGDERAALLGVERIGGRG
jgi:23S rRNA pseudouridine2457 synthase